jgi:propionyl-CoA carboxylase beta chain
MTSTALPEHNAKDPESLGDKGISDLGMEPAGAVPRARINALVDRGTFAEIHSRGRHRSVAFGMDERDLPGDGVVTGTARIDGRLVCVFAQDPKVMGGSLGEVHAAKITHVMDLAERSRCPVVALLDSGGARLQEGILAIDGYGQIFRRNARLSGRVPQISVVLGACAGGAVYSPGLTDLVVMTRESAMFLTGPRVVRAVTGEEVDSADLGGADLHAYRSGVVHLVAAGETAAADATRGLLSYLPSSCWGPLPVLAPTSPGPPTRIPTNGRKPYDVREVVHAIVDSASFLELQPQFARNIVIGLARLYGHAVGVVANQPLVTAGVLDINASEKAARFVRMCDSFGLPLLVLVDTPGFLPGTQQERDGIIRKGAKLLYAFSEATVPRATVVLRKAFGGGYVVMNSKSLGADAVFALPGAQIAAMGPEGAVEVLCRRELEDAPTSRADLEQRYRDEVMALDVAQGHLIVDEQVPLERVRDAVARVFELLSAAASRVFVHDNMPQ